MSEGANIAWLTGIYQSCRDIRSNVTDALAAIEAEDDKTAAMIKGYLKSDLERLLRQWPDDIPASRLGDMHRHIGFGCDVDYRDILRLDLPDVEKKAEQYALSHAHTPTEIGFENLLHPSIAAKALPQFKDGHYRDAVLNAVIAVFDEIRDRTGERLDGHDLIGRTLSLQNPRLILSEIESESGQNDQKGFMQIFQGIFRAYPLDTHTHYI